MKRYFLEIATSTNDLAKQLSPLHPEDFYLVTYRQMRGRGTSDKLWHSNPDKSLATLIACISRILNY